MDLGLAVIMRNVVATLLTILWPLKHQRFWAGRFSLVLCLVCIPSIANAADKPNVVFILVDDLGWMDVGYQNQKVETPSIDRLASEGLVFTQAYAAPVCSPARASILTGRTPATLKLTSHIPGVGFKSYYKRKFGTQHRLIDAEMIDHLPLEETTLAEAFKHNGYATGFFGKWHLAGGGSQKTKDGVVNPAWHPQAQGFDVNIGGCAYGQPAGPKAYFSPYANGEIADGPAGEYLTDRLVKDATAFMAANKDKAFFAYLSLYTIHSPLNPKRQPLQRAKGDRYKAMIYCMDEAVGRVMEAIDEFGLRDNTIVVFTSDNGGTRSQAPLRGRKGTVYEGGIRVPLIYRWPQAIDPGSTSSMPVSCEDFFPTLLDAAGIDAPKETKPIEGVSYLPRLMGQDNQKQRLLFQHFPHHRSGSSFMGASSLREGPWKLVWWHDRDAVELYHIEHDIGESINLAESEPDRANTLKRKLKQWLIDTQANIPRPNPKYVAEQSPKQQRPLPGAHNNPPVNQGF